MPALVGSIAVAERRIDDDGVAVKRAGTDDLGTGVGFGTPGRGVWRRRLLLGEVRGRSVDPWLTVLEQWVVKFEVALVY